MIEVVAAVRQIGAVANAGEVATRLGISREAAGIRLRRAMQEGLLERVRHGRYRVPTAPPAAEEDTTQNRTP